MNPLPDWFPGYGAGGIRWGLKRTEALLAGVGDPHRRFRSLHIGGTNGKGSVAALCDAVLRASRHHRVGLYTSPHLVSFTERIRIDGRPIADEVLRDAAEHLRPFIERTGASFFEAATALAFLCFAEAEVDVAVVEVGLGGRLDATNVITPVATAITNVGIEHTEYLGHTPAEIAREKAGIWKPGVPALTGEAEPEVVAVLRERATEVGAPFTAIGPLLPDRYVTDAHGVTLRVCTEAWGELELRVALRGAHQTRNAALAAQLLGILSTDLRPSLEAVRRGFAGVHGPRRMQVERIRGTTFLLDVAHNPAGASALAGALPLLGLPRPWVLVAGILADKDWQGMLATLGLVTDAAVLTHAPSVPADRRWDPERALGSLPAHMPARMVPELAEALDRAQTLAPHGTVIVTGSFYTVGDAMQHLGISPF